MLMAPPPGRRRDGGNLMAQAMNTRRSGCLSVTQPGGGSDSPGLWSPLIPALLTLAK